jgi:hypothetical protein
MSEILEAAATWWGDLLRHPKIRQRSGDLELDFVLSMTSSQTPIEEEKVRAFQDALIEILTPIMKDVVSGNEDEVIVSTDYSPDHRLGRALAVADIADHTFPIKTMMWIERRSISVSKGYGQPIQCIYQE